MCSWRIVAGLTFFVWVFGNSRFDPLWVVRKCPKLILVLFSCYDGGWQASSDHQQQRKLSVIHSIFCIFCTVVLLYFSNQKEKQIKFTRWYIRDREREDCIQTESDRELVCVLLCFLLQLKDVCRDTSDDETLFAVAPWQGIPQLLLKSLNLAGVGSADTLFRIQKMLCQTFWWP